MAVKILFLSANPTNNNIRIDQEVRDIEERIKRGRHRDELQFVPKFAVRPNGIQAALLDTNPTIVHISGHGDRLGSLVVEAPNGNGSIKIKPDGLGRLFGLFAQNIRCVLISACYSDEAVDAIHTHIPFVIGMKDAVHYDAARTFEIGFYDALVDGRPLPFAFNLGCNSMDLNGYDGGIPLLKQREGDPGHIFNKNEPPPPTPKPLSTAEYEQLRTAVHKAIDKPKMEEAFRMMIDPLEEKESPFSTGLLTLQKEFKELKKLRLVNAIAYSEYTTNMNRITMNLLNMLTELKP